MTETRLSRLEVRGAHLPQVASFGPQNSDEVLQVLH